MIRLSITFVIALWVTCNGVAAEPVAVKIASDGQAPLPIVVSQEASERVRGAADELANYLSQITGAEFTVESGDGSRGIAIGVPDDFSTKGPGTKWTTGNREHYLLRTHTRGVWVLGATELAVEHAVWDLLYRVGYRQYFPGSNWEVVPRQRELSLAVDTEQSPDYLARRIWYGYGIWDYNDEPYQHWCSRNRCVAGVELKTGHASDGIVRALRAEFDAHPEYWPLLDGKREPVTNPKPCLSNPKLRALIVEYALKQFAAQPTMDSVSMDPSDGGGWCQCERCAELGSVSDQAVTLANEVAAAIEKEYPGKLVGMYAYNYHSPTTSSASPSQRRDECGDVDHQGWPDA